VWRAARCCRSPRGAALPQRPASSGNELPDQWQPVPGPRLPVPHCTAPAGTRTQSGLQVQANQRPHPLLGGVLAPALDAGERDLLDTEWDTTKGSTKETNTRTARLMPGLASRPSPRGARRRGAKHTRVLARGPLDVRPSGTACLQPLSLALACQGDGHAGSGFRGVTCLARVLARARARVCVCVCVCVCWCVGSS
jgi:hypothetical protein